MTSHKHVHVAVFGLLFAVALASGQNHPPNGVGTVRFTRLEASTTTASAAASRNATVAGADRNRTASEEPLPSRVRPAYTRTELKVSRSLNPEHVQKLNVRSNNGRMVQIIVKKRNGMELPLGGPMQVGGPSTPVGASRLAGNYRLSADAAPESVDVVNAFLEHVNRIERPARSFHDEEHGAMKNDRRPVRIKVSDEAVQESRVPAPVVVSSDPVYMKDHGKTVTTTAGKRGRSMQEIGADGIPVVHGIRVPDDESDRRQVWRNARVINGELVPYEKGHVPTRLENDGDIYGQLIFARPLAESGASADSRQRSIGPFTTADNFQPTSGVQGPAPAKGFGPFSVEDNLQSAVRGVAVNPSNGGNIGPFSRADNSRPPANARLVEYLRRINEEESRRHYPQIASRANFKDEPRPADPDQPKIQRRMLQNPGHPGSYPVAQLYAPVPANSELPEDARKPVLQYAHPELGVQPAKSVPPERKPTKAMKKIMNVQEYYGKGAHNDHSPYAIEPAMGSKDYYDPPQPQHQAQHQQQQHQAPGKAPRHPSQPPPPFDGPFKGPAGYPHSYGYIRRVKHERPFWATFTDQMREGLQSGITSVQEFTKPVLEPIVEAGHKISKNLGLVRKTDEAQDKVGLVVAPAANSVILPALGLMAGGAALGLGAVAVGRFFDMGLLRRSGADFFPIDLDELDLEHKRGLEALHRDPDRYMMLVDRSSRTRRSLAEEHAGALQDVERPSTGSSRARFEQQLRDTDWKRPACAKRTFCRVMIAQGADDVVLMEKKMYTMLDMMHPTLAATLTDHLSEVTDAIRRNDCSRFVCHP